MMDKTYNRACAFVYRNARPLDLARWQYHFEDGKKETVLTALAAYQNEDGGFGHALEPDAWNPNSAPIQTWTATEILREINFTDSTHPIIQGILRYLAGGQSFDGHFWQNIIKSNNGYPHAQWWHAGSEGKCHHDYNPTACLAGFILRFSDRDSELYQLGRRIAKEAFDAYMGQEIIISDMHVTACYIRLLQYCDEAGVTDIFELATLREKLREQVKYNITKDTAEWETGYVCKPSQFFHCRDSIFYLDNRGIADYECDYIVESQQENGAWNIPWRWEGYPEEEGVSKNWWKSNGAILNMIYLKEMRGIE